MPLFGRTSAEDERRAEQYRDWLQARNPYAVASFVLGLFSLIEFGALIVFGIAGIALGVVALAQLKRDEAAVPKARGHVLAWLGISLSVLSLIVAGLLYFGVVGG